MNQKYVFAFLSLIIVTLACANPVQTLPTDAPANVETIVAGTISALTSPANNIPSPALDGTPPASTFSLLPYSMYYLGYDGANILQVFRLEKDGTTISQITFEPSDVYDYDVSAIDGSVVFVSNNNQLMTINADGSNRAMIYDGGVLDVNNPFVNQINSVVWSPNGETIAFGHQGLRFYSILSGQANLVLPNIITDQGNGFIFPEELIWPEKYSPDGSKLILTLGYYEGASTAIYYMNGGAVVRLTSNPGGIICCGDYALNNDATALYAASPTFGMFASGLWRVDTSNGNVTTLLQGDFDTNPANLADNPFIAPDGKLYFFYASVPITTEFVTRPPLQLVRSEIDALTNRTVLRPETFDKMNEALWSPDGSFVIIANPEIGDIYVGGAAQLYYIDGSKTMIPLVKFVQDMKWGP